MDNQSIPANVGSNDGLGLAPGRADLYDDVIVRLKFDPLTRAEQYAQLDRIAAEAKNSFMHPIALAR